MEVEWATNYGPIIGLRFERMTSLVPQIPVRTQEEVLNTPISISVTGKESVAPLILSCEDNYE